MKSTGTSYNFEAGYERIGSYLDGADTNYTEADSLPNRDTLTFSNGSYANCSAIFIDIRKSSSLPSQYTRPRLAKLYRAFVSEMVAVMDGSDLCREVNIVGDGVWGVFNTPLKSEIDSVFSVAFSLNSVMRFLNYQLVKHGFSQIAAGTGVSYGRALVIKAGFSGSGINDVVYMGDVVNQAAKLAAHGNETLTDRQMMVSQVFYNNLSDHNKGLLAWNHFRQAYHGDVVSVVMDKWYTDHCV